MARIWNPSLGFAKRESVQCSPGAVQEHSSSKNILRSPDLLGDGRPVGRGDGQLPGWTRGGCHPMPVEVRIPFFCASGQGRLDGAGIPGRIGGRCGSGQGTPAQFGCGRQAEWRHGSHLQAAQDRRKPVVSPSDQRTLSGDPSRRKELHDLRGSGLGGEGGFLNSCS